jgi:DNA polymerase
MMLRRDVILRELGLTRWVARERGSQSVSLEPMIVGELASGPGERVAHIASRSADAAAPSVSVLDWRALEETVRGCAACALCKGRTQSVFGVGDERADWLFVGEGPGAEEDARGEPFVGQAGRLLDNMLSAIELERGADVYIANIVTCRPPGNRVPEPTEADACRPYLQRQIELLTPRLIIALGRTAASNLLATESSIAALRGRVHDFHGIPLLVTYHPAYLLRNLADKAKAWEDLCMARNLMEKLKRGVRA